MLVFLYPPSQVDNKNGTMDDTEVSKQEDTDIDELISAIEHTDLSLADQAEASPLTVKKVKERSRLPSGAKNFYNGSDIELLLSPEAESEPFSLMYDLKIKRIRGNDHIDFSIVLAQI